MLIVDSPESVAAAVGTALRVVLLKEPDKAAVTRLRDYYGSVHQAWH